MRVITNLGLRVLDSEVQLLKMYQKISGTDVSINPFPWSLISATSFVAKYDAYDALRLTYVSEKAAAEVYKQERYAFVYSVRQDLQQFAQYVKFQSQDMYKVLGLYGYEILHSRDGLLKMPSRIEELDLLVSSVLDKHNLDGVNSLLNVFDVNAFVAKVAAMKLAKENYEASRLGWKLISTEKRALFAELIKMMKMIGKEMLLNPAVVPASLEAWGFVVTEFHKSA
jgi:hypothetical protein